MTPQERQLVTDLFDRLARLETSPRDAEAERAIADGTRRAPHSLYALVQTVLVQDEALKRADARIRELGGEDDAPAMRRISRHDAQCLRRPRFGAERARAALTAAGIPAARCRTPSAAPAQRLLPPAADRFSALPRRPPPA